MTPDPRPPTPVRAWSAVLAVSLGIFCLMTSELLPVGLLTPVAAGLGVSDGTAGLMVTGPGLVAALCAPLVTLGTARWDRRTVLCTLIALVAVANLAAALAADFAVLLAARLLVGVGIGGFWAIAGGLALRLVPARQAARATSVIVAGVAMASVLGVPAGTLLGELDAAALPGGGAGWRVAFAGVGALGLVALAALVLLLPPLPPREPVRPAALAAVVRGYPAVRTGLVVTFLLVTGQFAAYTFVRPVLQDVSGVAPSLIGTLLLGYGLAGVAGNFLAGAREARSALLVIGLLLPLVLVPVALVRSPVAGGALTVLWGLVYGGVSVSVQNWMNRAAPAAVEPASSLMVAVFNLAIALGAAGGGLTVDHLGTAAAPLAGAGLVLAAAAVLVATGRSGTPGSGPDTAGAGRDGAGSAPGSRLSPPTAARGARPGPRTRPGGRGGRRARAR
ncbi:MFS transporter [Streptomyces sp. NPDC089919]|uniref:MFS transporter n=1 Tax=Streptomyces sp. NPDC089919 TaxID=3155188 RepID=UPI0034406881